jgi:hypothetical protein
VEDARRSLPDGWARRWVGIEDAVVADPAEHLGTQVFQIVTDRDRVIAGIEDEQRDVAVCGKETDESAHLVDAGRRRVHKRRDALCIERCGPGVRCPVELADPLVGPSWTIGWPAECLEVE